MSLGTTGGGEASNMNDPEGKGTLTLEWAKSKRRAGDVGKSWSHSSYCREKYLGATNERGL